MAATATTAALQQTPITFQRTSSLRITFVNPEKLSFSGGLRLQNLSIKLAGTSRRGGGASSAKMADSAAGSYAAALAEVAVANGTLEATVKDLDLVDKLFSDSTNFNYFTSPIVSLEQKRALIDDVTASDLIKETVKEFELVYNKLTETELAVVSSVVKLEEQHLAQIAKQVQKLTGAKNVRVKTVIDESLVVGFTIRYGNSGSKLIDMSVKKQLEEIATQLEIGDLSLAV
ncbi:putative ATPase, OSCP/delta subunit, F1F0 ATP synthase OSCP/delta subunit domain superfamily [Helianthus annuus]|uniref:ATPase, OSCP/delta subunit, F1F0 ATP synthase OSCP/delta subunit domain superfamily n=1 Tax=Helianthus annuus TaxID=4232 RepID=A0A9K3JSD4_HELAN|nr:putative ATPase, OSCP/delta subunit, F1F0 ATP synthase OSCP/delta subunit domain superfamily [Helianthus annuus]KAJ0620797.1 putative ATPase, OSCP/delta subunit, F1F0 ATP synthase OSCP/delta subunit domain superfamily [Helianthus annuus]KAJ0955285.1 putative ATPase, OSCP/delta subunit, F1F0 ATP synthase OSCP/delta subunit domain superfamily [Helianthus annuus]